MIILDGKKVRDEKRMHMKKWVEKFSYTPTLLIIDISGGEASKAYIKQKRIFGESIEVRVLHLVFSAHEEEDIIETIEKANKDEAVHGIIVQLPVPQSVHRDKILNTIVKEKDVDGLGEDNQHLLYTQENYVFVPATARGVIELLEEYQFNFTGDAVVVGASLLTGKPIAELLRRKGMKVDMVDEHTENIRSHTQKARLVVSATGAPEIIDETYISEGAWVIDVGFSRIERQGEYKIVGDVDKESIRDKTYALSPVPGGVGPMTVLALFENVLRVPFDL